jgi:hypothetical protein
MSLYGARSARSGEPISLGVNADGDDNGKPPPRTSLMISNSTAAKKPPRKNAAD